MTTVQLRSGLIVLIQQNLLLFREDPVTQATTYEANADAAYNILRNGKILEMIGDRYGAAERELVHTLLLFGHIQISDLTEHFEAKIGQNGGSGKTNGVPNGEATVNGVRQGQHGASTGHIESAAHVNSLLNRLIQDGLVEVVHKWTFQSLEDIQDEVEMELAKKCPLEERKGKKKAEYTKLFISRLEEILDEGQSLKRKLDQNSSASSKRRRLLDRAKSNGWVTVQQDPWLDVSGFPCSDWRSTY